jgi:hypothetical protein
MSSFGNQPKLVNQSKLMANSTLQRHLLMLTMIFRNLLESWDVTFRGW